MDLFTIILIVCIAVLWFGGCAIQDWYRRGHPLPKSDPDPEAETGPILGKAGTSRQAPPIPTSKQWR